VRALVAALIVLAGCEEPAEDDACPDGMTMCDDKCVDAVEPRLSALQQSLFPTCAFQGCHGATGPQEMLQMDTAAQSYMDLVDVPAVQLPDMLRVEPGAPERSYLINKLRGEGLAPMSSSGGASTQMPQGAPPLCEARIQAVEAWIEDGAAND
jgi:hypothetical protein